MGFGSISMYENHLFVPQKGCVSQSQGGACLLLISHSFHHGRYTTFGGGRLDSQAHAKKVRSRVLRMVA
jgi:hypothetical protein